METCLDNMGTQLWSVATGAGTPMILCNGGPGCDDYLGPVAEMVEDLCKVVRYEPRGCGRSDWDKRYDLETTLKDIDFVRKAYGFEKVMLCGHSSGVGMALAYALKEPEAVLGIVGIAGGCMVNDRTWSRIYHENLEKYGEDNGGRIFRSDPEVNKVGVTSWREFITAPTLLRDLAKLSIPAVLINAGSDIRPNWPTRQLACLLQKGEYVEVAGAGHYIWITHKTELKKEVRAAVQKMVGGKLSAGVDRSG